MGLTSFEEKKRSILQALAQPEESYTDASPKGSVDEHIRSLVDKINEHDGLVTTSSCSGRIAIYLEGSTTAVNQDEVQDKILTAVQKTTGGKGGGRWLFVSHDPIDILSLGNDDHFLTALSLNTSSQGSCGSSNPAYVHLKFEPMILHVLCSTMDTARKVLGAALSAGFRESGISSINDQQDMIMVGIRTNGLAFDSIIAKSTSYDNEVNMLVSTKHVKLLLNIGNDRFNTNQLRMERFTSALMSQLHKRDATGPPGWEDAETRRARKRAEGLARRQQLQSGGIASEEHQNEDVLNLDPFQLD